MRDRLSERSRLSKDIQMESPMLAPSVVEGGCLVASRLREASERFVKTFLDAFVIQLLAEGPKYGLLLMRDLEGETGVKIGCSTFYPLMCSLEDMNLVTGRWYYRTRRRRVYSLTGRGVDHLNQVYQQIASLVRVLSQNVKPYQVEAGNDLQKKEKENENTLQVILEDF